MEFEKFLVDNKISAEDFISLLNKHESSLLKDGFWKLWNDRNTVISEWNRLNEIVQRNRNRIK